MPYLRERASGKTKTEASVSTVRTSADTLSTLDGDGIAPQVIRLLFALLIPQ